MAEPRKVVGNLVNILTSELESICGRFQIAVSEIDYEEFGFGNLKILGGFSPNSPYFINQNTPNGMDLLRNRIMCGGDQLLPDQMNCPPPKYPSESTELTYSSIAASVKKEQERFSKVRSLGALLITNGIPMFEPMSVEGALEQIHKVVPAERFVASSISYTKLTDKSTNEDQRGGACEPDTFGRDSNQPFSLIDAQKLEQFMKATGGRSFNFCAPWIYEQELREFIRTLIHKSYCLIA